MAPARLMQKGTLAVICRITLSSMLEGLPERRIKHNKRATQLAFHDMSFCLLIRKGEGDSLSLSLSVFSYLHLSDFLALSVPLFPSVIVVQLLLLPPTANHIVAVWLFLLWFLFSHRSTIIAAKQLFEAALPEASVDL